MDLKHDLTPEEQQVLLRLVQRQHETEDAESRLIERYGNRASVAKSLWTAIIGIVAFIILATSYVLSLQSSVERNSRDAAQLRLDVNRNSDSLFNLRLEMKDKSDKPK